MSAPGSDSRLEVHADRGSVAAKKIYGGVHVDNRRMVAAREVRWPVQVGQPPRLAVGFQHRPDLDGQLSGIFAGHSADAEAGDGAVVTRVLSGDGGMGKTQMAVSVFERAALDLRVWLTATSLDRLVTGLADAAISVQSPSWDDEDSARAAGGFLGWLATTERSWLVVLDDLSVSDREMATWWPPRSPSGRVLVTSRRRDSSSTGHGRRRIEVDSYTEQEALDYLSRRIREAEGTFPAEDLAAGSAELTSELGCLPVALAQAVSVMINDAISAAEYLEQYRDRSLGLAELMRDWDDTDGYERTVAATWSLAVDGADRLRPAGLARPAALLASVLDPTGVPETMWTSTTARKFLAAFRAAPASEPDPTPQQTSAEQARSALRSLHRYSLVQHIPAHQATAVRMHAVTQRALRDTLAPQDVDALATVAADALAEIWPEETVDAELVAALRASTTRLTELAPDALMGTRGSRSPVRQRAEPG